MNTIHSFLILFIVISGSFNSSDGFWGLKNTTSDLKINFKYSLAKIHFSLFKTCIPVLIRQACSWKFRFSLLKPCIPVRIRQACSWKMITYRSKRKKPCTGLFSGFHFWARFQTGYRTGLLKQETGPCYRFLDSTGCRGQGPGKSQSQPVVKKWS